MLGHEWGWFPLWKPMIFPSHPGQARFRRTTCAVQWVQCTGFGRHHALCLNNLCNVYIIYIYDIVYILYTYSIIIFTVYDFRCVCEFDDFMCTFSYMYLIVRCGFGCVSVWVGALGGIKASRNIQRSSAVIKQTKAYTWAQTGKKTQKHVH
jgi:hypothetical protein